LEISLATQLRIWRKVEFLLPLRCEIRTVDLETSPIIERLRSEQLPSLVTSSAFSVPDPVNAKVSIGGQRLFRAVNEDCSSSERLSGLIIEESDVTILQVSQRNSIFRSSHENGISCGLIAQSLRAFAHEIRG
jgi:hypothetical protein